MPIPYALAVSAIPKAVPITGTVFKPVFNKGLINPCLGLKVLLSKNDSTFFVFGETYPETDRLFKSNLDNVFFILGKSPVVLSIAGKTFFEPIISPSTSTLIPTSFKKLDIAALFRKTSGSVEYFVFLK